MSKPFFVEILEKADPQLLEQMNSVRDFVSPDGALPEKVKTLMGMLADSLLGHSDGVKAIADRARAQGAGEAEIAETVRVAFYYGGVPALVTAVHAFRE